MEKAADLSRGNARVVQPDHELVGDAGCGEGLEQQVCAVVLGSTHQQAGTFDCPVHLSGHIIRCTLLSHQLAFVACCTPEKWPQVDSVASCQS